MSTEVGEGGRDFVWEVGLNLWVMESPGQVPVKGGSGPICVVDVSVKAGSRPGAGKPVLRPLPFSR